MEKVLMRKQHHELWTVAQALAVLMEDSQVRQDLLSERKTRELGASYTKKDLVNIIVTNAHLLS